MKGPRLTPLPTAIAAIAAALCLAPAAASAATITPTAAFVADDHTDNANCSLREAVSIANANDDTIEDACAVTGPPLGDDTIALGAGTYVLDINVAEGVNPNATSDLDVDTTGDLTIDGEGATTTTIDSNLVSPTDRVITSGAGSGTLAVSDLTVAGGSETNGGGISSTTGLTLERTRVRLNAATNLGGGVRADGFSLSITDSVISENDSGADGGGVNSSATTTTIYSSVIRGNSAVGPSPSGGGIAAGNNTLTVIDSVIVDNDATDTGVGVSGGGGLTFSGTVGSATIRGTTVSQNKVLGGSSRVGGGMSLGGFGPVPLTVINSTISANEALGAGGGAAGLNATPGGGGTLTVAQTTFGPNPVGAGGVSAIFRAASGPVNVRGSVVETSGTAPACGGGSMTSLDDNIFTDSTCGSTIGNDEADADPMLGPLADNGGPDAGAPGLLEAILTHLPAQASTVVDHVPAVDCDDEPSGSLLIDQRGLLRPFNGDGSGAADCDSGSVELQTALPPPPPASGGGQPTVQPPATTPAAKKKCKKAKKGAVAAKKKCKKKKKKK